MLSVSKNPVPFTFIDLFAGIGGLRRGFESVGGRCVFTSEWDRFAVKTYRGNYPDDTHELVGDITQVPEDSIPCHDVLLAGFPCQPFSLAGVSKKNSLGRAHGFGDELQGNLFFDVARIIAHHRPPVVLLENVKNLVSHDGGKTFRIIRQTLEKDLGYHLHYKVIDAKAYVPQHRERIFMVALRDDSDFSFDDLNLVRTQDGPRLGSILHPEDGSEQNDPRFTDEQGRVHDKYVLSDKLWNYLQAYAEKHRLKGNGFGCSVFGPDDVTRTLSARYYKDGSEILVRRKKGNPRRLTPRECSRLMGFDQLGGSDFRIQVSDTQAYRQFGNSVVPLLIQDLAKGLLPVITEAAVQKNQNAVSA